MVVIKEDKKSNQLGGESSLLEVFSFLVVGGDNVNSCKEEANERF